LSKKPLKITNFINEPIMLESDLVNLLNNVLKIDGKFLTSIRFDNSELPNLIEDYPCSGFYNIKRGSEGYGGVTICCRSIYKEGLSTPEQNRYLVKAILHEVGHAVWFRGFRHSIEGKRPSARFLWIWGKEMKGLESLAKTKGHTLQNEREGFAEAYAWYHLDRDNLVKCCPKIVKFFDENLILVRQYF
jgi:hypothetical protein